MSGFGGAVALVTGAGSGIGAAVASELAAGGASVVVNDLRQDAAAAQVEAIVAAGGTAVAHAGDATDPAVLQAAVARAVSTYGALTLAVNNAGAGGPSGLLAEVPIDGYRRLIELNLNAVFYGMHAEIPAMLAAGGGSIVNVSSILGLVAEPTALPYTTAKHGVTGMTRAAAAGYAAQGVRVNSVHPGYIETPLLAGMDDDRRAALVARHPAGRLGTAAEVSAVVCFLLSDAASFVTGSQYTVDGGYTAV